MRKPLVRIPTVAIHLDRTQNEAMKYNQETGMQAILGLIDAQVNAEAGQASASGSTAITANHHPRLLELVAKELSASGSAAGTQVQVADIHDFELSLFDVQPPTLGGADEEFVFSARLDNLFSSFCAFEALAEATETGDVADGAIPLIVGDHSMSVCPANDHFQALYDHEEIGSVSAGGADSNFLEAIIQRITGNPAIFDQTIANSYLLSCDMGHAIHPAPDHANKHQAEHRPVMGGGPAIKTNAKVRYTSTAPTTFLLRKIAEMANVPLQEFEVRNDQACGSTIGPILASRQGLRAVDIGCVQLSMHSIRETAGSKDVAYLLNLFKTFFQKFSEVDKLLSIDE